MANYAFDSSIPKSTNNPSVDQPVMQQNNASISSLVATDHVGFNIEGGGLHSQATFVQLASKPPVVSPQIALYSKLVAALGTSQLFFEDSAGVESQMTGTLVNTGAIGPPPTFSGEYILQGGLIIKWGNSAAADGSTITFTTAFPNACFGVVITVNKTGISSTTTVVTAEYPSVTGFKFRQTGDSSANRFWIALGN